MSLNTQHDLVVIGGGSAGYAAARTAAAAGLKTCVVEGGREIGGLCILRGCMPTKALLYAAEIMHLVQKAKTWGINARSLSVDFREVMARKDRLIKDFADYRSSQLRDGRFEFIRSSAEFLDAHTIVLGDGRKLESNHFVIATGSMVPIPPVPGLADIGYLTSDEALTLGELPRSLVILGGGAVAVEFAQFFARFGVRVTLIQRSPQILRDFDPDAADTVASVLRKDGVEVITGTKLLSASRSGDEAMIEFEHGGERRAIHAESIMHTLGRTPNTALLKLDRAGVQTENGRILTDASMRSSANHIYAAGDCTGPYEIVHIAVQQGEIAAHNIAHPDRARQIDYRLLTSVVFTDPQVATVGLTEKQAKSNGVHYITASYPFNDHGKSLIMEALDGFVKLLADPVSGEILGGCVVGPSGGELIHEITAAMFKRMTVQELAAMPHYHPTLAEIWTYPAEELAGQLPQG